MEGAGAVVVVQVGPHRHAGRAGPPDPRTRVLRQVGDHDVRRGQVLLGVRRGPRFGRLREVRVDRHALPRVRHQVDVPLARAAPAGAGHDPHPGGRQAVAHPNAHLVLAEDGQQRDVDADRGQVERLAGRRATQRAPRALCEVGAGLRRGQRREVDDLVRTRRPHDDHSGRRHACSSRSPRCPPSGDLGVQGVEAVLPQRPIGLEPLVDLDERLGPQAVDAPLRVLLDRHETGLAQHPQVTRHTGAGDRQGVGELGDGRRMVPQDLQHGAATPVTDRLQHRVHELTYRMCYIPTRVRNVPRASEAGRPPPQVTRVSGVPRTAARAHRPRSGRGRPRPATCHDRLPRRGSRCASRRPARHPRRVRTP